MAFDDERFWGRESVPKLSPIGAFVMAEPFGLDTSIAGVFHCKGSQRLITVSILFFFDVLPHLRMQCRHHLFENAIHTPLLVMPEYRRVGR